MKGVFKTFALSTLVGMGIVTLFPVSGIGAFSKDYLIWDVDVIGNSGPQIDAALKQLGYCGDYAAVSATNLANNYTPFTDYAAIYICLGTYPNNYNFGNQPGDGVVDSLLFWYFSFTNPPDTPHIYLEGGDFWCYDPGKPGFYPMFRVDSLNCMDGFHDLDINTGVSNTCMEGLSFNYVGENQYIDRLIKTSPPDTAVYLFENGPDSVYYSSVGYRPPSRQYVSIASSFEFGGIESNSQVGVMDSIMGCFFERAPGSFATDAAALRIILPGPFADPGVPLFPKIEVQNKGSSTESFLAHCEIMPGSFTSTVTVSNLPPGAVDSVTFPDPWIPGSSCILFDVRMWVELAGDLNVCNDSIQSSTTSWKSSESINSPFSTNTPTIDGIISPGEWTDAESLDISDILDRGGTGSMGCNAVKMYVKNDSSNSYFAIDAIADTSFDISDTDMFFFDDNHNEIFDPSGNEGRIRLITFPPPSAPDSVFFQSYNPCLNPPESITSLLGDAGFTPGHVQSELRIPLNPSGLNEELNANPGDTVGMWVNVADGAGMGHSIGWWPTVSNFDFGASCPDASLMGDLVLGDAEPSRDVGVVNLSWPPEDLPRLRSGDG
jgi:hypothetical protein